MSVHFNTARLACRASLAAMVTVALLAGLAHVTADAKATPTRASTTRIQESAGTQKVAVDPGPVSVPSNGAFRIGVEVQVEEPTPYLEMRLQIHRPTGRLLFQRTEVRNQVETGTVSAEFSRELADLELAPAAYPFEVRVRTEVGEPREQKVSGALLIHAPEPTVAPVALVVRLISIPGFDPQGHFVTDPASSTAAIDEVEALAQAVLADSSLRMTLAVAPMVLDEWMRVSDGYQLVGPEGLTEVDAGEELPRRYSEVLELLRDAVSTGRLELLDVPYADPDIDALESTRPIDDLDGHYTRGTSTYLSSLGTTPSAGTALAADKATAATLSIVEQRGASYILLGSEHLSSEDTTPPGGVYDLDGNTLTGLVINHETSESLASEDVSAAVRLLFEHAVSEEATIPTIALVEAGPGREGSVDSALAFLSTLEQVPWAEALNAYAVATMPANGTLIPPARTEAAPSAPPRYWQEVAEARRYADALLSAAGANDSDAQAVTEASLIAQSAYWAGPDGRWSMADRGRSFAHASTRHARSFLDEVSITAKDVTLAGPRGEVPLSITNDSPKTLDVTLKVRTDDIYLAQEPSAPITLRRQENLHTLSVDLQSALSGRLDVEVWADEILLDSDTIVVRASYLDRLAVIGGVVLLLLGLLFYIRRRVSSADADKMP